jgi:N-acetyl-anhydromuramyl-L-alanine amidase AmpD
MPSLDSITNGRPDVPGPLAQLGLGRDGTFFVVAAGRAAHAGAGMWQGIRTGNSSFIGIQGENTGHEDWPSVQLLSYQRGVAAILKKIGANALMCCGHKEYALPTGRLSDPSFDMQIFRTQVAHLMAGTP